MLHIKANQYYGAEERYPGNLGRFASRPSWYSNAAIL